MNEQPVFTAARIAAVLRVKRQSVQRMLEGLTCTTQVLVSGQKTAAWCWSALPVTLHKRLDAEGQRLGYGCGEALLRRPVAAWKPPMPLANVAQHCIDKAVKLQRVLLPLLSRRAGLNAAEFEALGVRDYAAVFGHTITTRHFRELYSRTVERDAGAENWTRLDLFLDARPAAKPTLTVFSSQQEAEFAELHDFIALCRNPSQPTPEEERALWIRVMEVRDELRASKSIKRRLVKFLLRHAPWLAASEGALRVAFHRQQKRWEQGGRKAEALLDGRRKRKGERRAIYPKGDRDKIIWAAGAKHGNRLAPALRELVENRDLTAGTIERLLIAPANKSYVPQTLRADVTPEIKALAPYHMGPRAVDQVRPSIERRYDRIPSEMCFQGDDVTLPVYWFVPDGKGWFSLVRGQCLIMIDFRSMKVLGFSLQPDRNYNSLVIRSLITKVCSDWNLPKIFYFERGIWYRSRILKGDLKAEATPFSTPEVELGLRGLGVKFKHAIRARSKLVERVIGLLQDLMGGEPGYCGRDERKDCPEQVRRQKLDVEARRCHPKDHFYDFDQWQQRLTEIITKYNATEQQGRVLNRMSPDEAFEKFKDRSNPPITFDASCRHLLSHYKCVTEVKHGGVTILGKFRFYGKQLNAHIGKRMMFWFDPQNPEVVVVTDMKEKNPFCVERAGSTDALDAEPEEYAREAARVESHLAHTKARFISLKNHFGDAKRVNLVPSSTAALGAEIERSQNQAASKRTAKAAAVGKIQSTGRKLGVPAHLLNSLSSPQAARGLSTMEELERQHEKSIAESDEVAE
jgi:hypothetical protein